MTYYTVLSPVYTYTFQLTSFCLDGKYIQWNETERDRRDLIENNEDDQTYF